MPHSSTTARREFAIRVQARRRDLGLAATEVVDRVGLSRVYYSKVENAHVVLGDSQLPKLAELLAFDETETAELAELLTLARQGGWWESYSRIYPDHPQFLEFVGLEQGASRLRIHEGRAITGLLQTEAYAAAVIDDSPDVKATEVRLVTELRLRRGDILRGEGRPTLDLVISEAAILQVFGDPGVLRDQLEALVESIHSGVVRVQVQPFNQTPLGLSNASTLVLLEFDSNHLPTVAWTEDGAYSARLVEDPTVVESLIVNFELARTSCLDHARSLDLIQARIDSLAETA